MCVLSKFEQKQTQKLYTIQLKFCLTKISPDPPTLVLQKINISLINFHAHVVILIINMGQKICRIKILPIKGHSREAARGMYMYT